MAKINIPLSTLLAAGDQVSFADVADVVLRGS